MKLNWDCFNDTLLAIEELTSPVYNGQNWIYNSIKCHDIVNKVKTKGYTPEDIINSVAKMKDAGFIIVSSINNEKVICHEVYDITYSGCAYIRDKINKPNIK